MGSHAYATTNVISAVAASGFVWSNGAVTDRGFLNDARMDKSFIVGAAVASGINVIIDAGSIVDLRAVAVLNSNAAVQKTDATLKVEASSSATFAADVNVAKAASTLYSTTSPKNKDHVLQFPTVGGAPPGRQYWRLTWTWTGNVTNFQLGEIFMASTVTTLARRTVYGSGESAEANVGQVQMQYGETRGVFLSGPVRQLDTQWDDLTASQRDELYNMHVAANFGAKPLLWIASQEAVATAAAATEQEVLYGRLQKPGFQWSEKDFALYQPGGFSIRSLGREAGA